jgi:peptidoglycan-associated lipoprotein
MPAAPPQAPPPPETIGDVFFDYDQAVLRSEALDILGANARLLRQREGKITIEGHCDERGTVAYNFVLGERRASAVKRFLEDSGVPGSQIAIVSYGKEQPFCSEHSTVCWQSNRRAHFVLR